MRPQATTQPARRTTRAKKVITTTPHPAQNHLCTVGGVVSLPETIFVS